MPSGTSIAAPHVAGVIALALSARAKKPGTTQFNSYEIRSALRKTVKHSSQWDETTGFGEVDAEAFFKALA
jgi:subtilisin family serine protease